VSKLGRPIAGYHLENASREVNGYVNEKAIGERPCLFPEEEMHARSSGYRPARTSKSVAVYSHQSLSIPTSLPLHCCPLPLPLTAIPRPLSLIAFLLAYSSTAIPLLYSSIAAPLPPIHYHQSSQPLVRPVPRPVLHLPPHRALPLDLADAIKEWQHGDIHSSIVDNKIVKLLECTAAGCPVRPNRIGQVRTDVFTDRQTAGKDFGS
jgi:hypothetical protein